MEIARTEHPELRWLPKYLMSTAAGLPDLNVFQLSSLLWGSATLLLLFFQAWHKQPYVFSQMAAGCRVWGGSLADDLLLCLFKPFPRNVGRERASLSWHEAQAA